MKFGLVLPTYGRLARATSIIQAAVLAENLGYNSVWTTDHVMVPANFRQPYGNTFEVLTTLAYVAAKTSTVQLGTSLVVAPLRNPIQLAKQCATIDVLSTGRMILGAGSGYLQEEFHFLGGNFQHRGRYFDECIRVMREVWKDDPTSFEGEFFRFSNAYAAPKPMRGMIPIWIGGDSRAAMRRAAVLGDGWHPGNLSPEKFAKRMNELKKMANGRRVTTSVRLTVDFAKEPDQNGHREKNNAYKLAGSASQMADDLEEYAKLGLDHLLCEFAEIENQSVGSPSSFESSIHRFAKEVAGSFG